MLAKHDASKVNIKSLSSTKDINSMPDDNPLISILLPVRNGERWIGECLESIRSQTFTNYELLIVDDGCTDRTIPIALQMDMKNMRIISGPQRGLGAALAIGVNAARAPFVARQDQDDLSLPLRLEKQVSYMLNHTKCAVVGSWAQHVDEMGKNIRVQKTPESDRSIRFGLHILCPFIHSSVLLRTSAVLSAGNYRTANATVFAEDYDLWSRIAPYGQFHNIQEVLISYRVNLEGISMTQGRELRQSGSAIAIRNIENTLGVSLTKYDKEVVSFFFVAEGRATLRHGFSWYWLVLRILLRSGFPPPLRGLSWRAWARPFVWIFRSPRNSRQVSSNSI